MRCMRIGRALRIGGAAVAALVVTTGALGQVNIATGPSPAVDGYLRVGADAYGSFNSVTFGGLGDTYNPVGAHSALEANFSNGFMIFASTGSTRRRCTAVVAPSAGLLEL